MPNRSFIEALDEALTLLEQGYPFEYCVRQFPEYEDRLRPLLQVGDDLRRVANTTNAALQKAQVEPDWERLLAGVPQQQVGYIDSLRSTLASFCQTYFGVTTQRYVLLATMVVFVCITSLAGIFATLQSRPGDTLYGLRPGAKQLVLTATRLDPDTQHQLSISFAVQDVEGINVLVRQKQPIAPETIEQALGQVRAAIEAARQSGDVAQLSPQLIQLRTELEQLKQQREYVAVESEIDSLDNELAALVAPTDVVAAAPPDDSSQTTGQPAAAGGSVEQGETTAPPPTRSPTPAQVGPDESSAPIAGGQPPLPTDDAAVGDDPTNTPGAPPATATEEPTQAPTETAVPEPAATETPTPSPTDTPPAATETPTPVPATETPTPSPTPEPTMTPEPTPSPVPATETPTPSPTPEPTMTPEPTPTPSPTETAQALSTTTPTPAEPLPEQATATPSATETPATTPTPAATETPATTPTPSADESDVDANQEASPEAETP